MSFSIIVLRPDDAPRVATLHAAATNDPWPVQDHRNLLKQHTTLGLGICSDETGALNAFLLCQIVIDTADLLIVATDPACQRQGCARCLMTGLLSRLGERGTERLTLEVAADNPAAIALYDSMEFSEDGRRPGYYARGNLKVDGILMSRRVSGLPPTEKA